MERIRTIPVNKAKREIEVYIKHKKQKVWIEDLINDLRIDPVIIVRVIKQLEKEGKIKNDRQTNGRPASRR